MDKPRKFYEGEYYHIFNRSIAKYGIFNDPNNCQRFIKTLDYYNEVFITERLSYVLRKNKYVYSNLLLPKTESIVKYLSYKIMPNHYHLLIKILKNYKLSKYVNDFENSFSRYFNIKFNRKGPIWESSFKAVKINTNEQLLHVSRYMHLNAVTSGLVKKPEDWKFSSYKDLITNKKFLKEIITDFSISNNIEYKKFVENNIDYQKRLHLIKKLLLE
jgi:putative transposase